MSKLRRKCRRGILADEPITTDVVPFIDKQ